MKNGKPESAAEMAGIASSNIGTQTATDIGNQPAREMTTRELMATKIMAGFAANSKRPDTSVFRPKEKAKDAVIWTDALLNELARTNSQTNDIDN